MLAGHKLLVASPIQERSRGRGQTKGKPWSSKLEELGVRLTSHLLKQHVKKPNNRCHIILENGYKDGELYLATWNVLSYVYLGWAFWNIQNDL